MFMDNFMLKVQQDAKLTKTLSNAKCSQIFAFSSYTTSRHLNASFLGRLYKTGKMRIPRARRLLSNTLL